MSRRGWAIAAAVVIVAAIGILFVYHPAFYLPFFFLFIPIGLFGRRRTYEPDDGEADGGYCAECGNAVEPDDTFCRVCGAMLDRRHRGRRAPGDGSSPPSVSDGIQLRVLPTGPGSVFPVVRTCSGGESPFHQIPGNVAAWRFILSARSVSFLCPCHGSRRIRFPDPPHPRRRELPQLAIRPTVSRPPSPGMTAIGGW